MCGSILVVTRGPPRESLNLRVPPELKRRVVEHATRTGIPINAAASVLLDEGLRAQRRKR